METGEKTLLEHFEGLEDPRSRQSPHALDELLLTAVCAVLSGADGWAAVALWGRAKLDWLRRFLPFENGVASHDTFGRVFSLLDAAVFEECFIAWMRSVCGAFEGLQVALDGKTVRRSASAGSKAIHVVSAFAHGLGLALGQVKTAEKSNEITAIPELLDALLLKGCIVTIDAAGCQKAIAAKIVAQESDYALALRTTSPAWRRRWKASSTRRNRPATEALRTRRPNGSRKTTGASRRGAASSPTTCAAWETATAGRGPRRW